MRPRVTHVNNGNFGDAVEITDIPSNTSPKKIGPDDIGSRPGYDSELIFHEH